MPLSYLIRIYPYKRYFAINIIILTSNDIPTIRRPCFVYFWCHAFCPVSRLTLLGIGLPRCRYQGFFRSLETVMCSRIWPPSTWLHGSQWRRPRSSHVLLCPSLQPLSAKFGQNQLFASMPAWLVSSYALPRATLSTPPSIPSWRSFAIICSSFVQLDLPYRWFFHRPISQSQCVL